MKDLNEIRNFILSEMRPPSDFGDDGPHDSVIDAADLLAFLEDKDRDEVRFEHPEAFRIDDAERFGL